MKLVERYAERLKEAQFMGKEELRDTIMDKDFLSAELLNGGYKFRLATDDGNVYELNTVTGSLRLIPWDSGTDPVINDPDEKTTLAPGLLLAINKAVAKDFTSSVRVYTLQEVADLLKVTRQTIYNYVTAGRLHAVKFGKEYRVTESDLQKLIQKGRN